MINELVDNSNEKLIPLTRKYVFECALKGKRIRISNKTFADTRLVRRCGLISKINENGMCRILHNVAVLNPPGNGHTVWRAHKMDAGTQLANMVRLGK